jgi:hypothetical protein
VYENDVLVVSDDTAPGSGTGLDTKTLTWSSVPATQPQDRVSFDLKAPLEATGGRLLVEDGAPSGLALYGSNDAGQNWMRVASLDVISTARNYGCGSGSTVSTSCKHDIFGPAPVGSHVYRFVAANLQIIPTFRYVALFAKSGIYNGYLKDLTLKLGDGYVLDLSTVTPYVVGPLMYTVTASDGFANVSSALNASFSFLFMTLSYEKLIFDTSTVVTVTGSGTSTVLFTMTSCESNQILKA